MDKNSIVLILVWLEDGQGARNLNVVELESGTVLILVWLEDGQGVLTGKMIRATSSRLNPCLVGRWSRSSKHYLLSGQEFCLNPCLVGRWSRRTITVTPSAYFTRVLILVWLEDGQGDY